MTLEQRLDAHDEYVRLATQVLAENQQRLEAQEQRLDAHDEYVRLATQVLGENQQRLDAHDESVRLLTDLLADVRRDSAQTQQLWVRLAARYGWLEDDEG